jgi:2-polyprenyl-6-hydroxyphenyl methylase/3-demethylubiquinone-9 3-methyltransferase
MVLHPSEQEIILALQKVEGIVRATDNKSDLSYFNFHKRRYLRMAMSIASKLQVGASVLNIGSHYLHTSLLFKFIGYEVSSMDVGFFWDLDFVKERGTTYDLLEIIENDLETFKSHTNISDKYEVVLFAEILEHITFNPVFFWKTVYSILKPGGIIYISTPNSLNLYNIARTLGRIITIRGVGLPIGSIFANVTYGHHWKEYSAREIRKYFQMLSNDFHVSTSFYHYREPNDTGFSSAVFSFLSAIGNWFHFMSDEIEAIVTVEKSGNWKIESPDY